MSKVRCYLSILCFRDGPVGEGYSKSMWTRSRSSGLWIRNPFVIRQSMQLVVSCNMHNSGYDKEYSRPQ